VRIDIIDLLALAILIVAVFVTARTWGRVTVPVSVALFALALAQALWVLGVIPPLGEFGARTWAAIACGMLVILGIWLAQVAVKLPIALAGVVSVAATVELLVLSGILRLG
jgi:hypothetical protein